MVPLPKIINENTTIPSHLTAVFVGGTSGIGLYTLLALSTHCHSPKIYIVGRSASAASNILSDLKSANPRGTYTFLRSDISLLKNVDDICGKIRDREDHVDLLVMSQGVMSSGTDTAEGIHLPASLLLHSRVRFILNMLPLLGRAPVGSPKRVVSIFTGTKEGNLPEVDVQFRNLPARQFIAMRGLAASAVTLSMEMVAKKKEVEASGVAFVHTFPGPVRSGIAREGGVFLKILAAVGEVVGRWFYVPESESGERHLWSATTGRFVGVGVAGGKGDVAIGTNGKKGSGVYAVDEKCEVGNAEVVKVLGGLRDLGRDEMVWKQLRDEFLRVTGRESMWDDQVAE